MEEGNLLYEIRVSDSKLVQFLESAGELAVSFTGKSALDALPPAEFSGLAPTELFARITGEPAPERLLAAETAAATLDAHRSESGVDDWAHLLEGGPEAGSQTAVAEDPGRQFLATTLPGGWWSQTACGTEDIDYHFTLGNEYYHRFVGCWANNFVRVNTGDLGITLDYRVAWDGTSGSTGTIKYWWVNCETFLIEVCEWKNKNYTVAGGFWRQLNFWGRKSRATDYTHPTGGHFAVKYNSPYIPQPFCISPTLNCIYEAE